MQLAYNNQIKTGEKKKKTAAASPREGESLITRANHVIRCKRPVIDQNAKQKRTNKQKV